MRRDSGEVVRGLDSLSSVAMSGEDSTTGASVIVMTGSSVASVPMIVVVTSLTLGLSEAMSVKSVVELDSGNEVRPISFVASCSESDCSTTSKGDLSLVNDRLLSAALLDSSNGMSILALLVAVEASSIADWGRDCGCDAATASNRFLIAMSSCSREG